MIPQTVLIAVLGINISYPIKGQIAAGQSSVVTASYSDSIVATVTY